MNRHLLCVAVFAVVFGCQPAERELHEPTPTLPAPALLSDIWALKDDDEAPFAETRGALEAAAPQLPPRGRRLAEVYLHALLVFWAKDPDAARHVEALGMAARETSGVEPCVLAQAALYRTYVTTDPPEVRQAQIALLDAAIPAARRCGEARLVGQLLYERAIRRREGGDQVSRYRDLRAARIIFDQGGVREGPRYTLWIDLDLAAQRHDLGDLDGQRERYEGLRPRAQALQERGVLGTIERNLASLELDEGQPELAEARVRRLLADGLGGGASGHYPSYLTLARACLDQGGPSALGRAREALAYVRQHIPDAAPARHHAMLGWLEARADIEAGHFDGARQRLEAILAEPQEAEARWRSLSTLAEIHHLRANLDAERAVLWDAISLLEAERAQTALVQGPMAHRSQRVDLYLRWLRALVEAYLATRSSSPVGGEQGLWDPAETFPAGPVLADDLLAAVDRIAADNFNFELWLEGGGLQASLEAPQAGVPTPWAWRSGRELREQLSVGDRVIVLAPLGDYVLALDVQRDQVAARRIPVAMDELVAAQAALREGLVSPTLEAPPELKSLGGQLLRPLLNDVPLDTYVGFVMLDPLGDLPIQAMSWDDRYLVERIIPFELPSLASLEWLPDTRPRLSQGDHALFVTTGAGLSGPHREGAALVGGPFGVTRLLDRQATVEKVKGALPGARLVHFAVHGTRLRAPAQSLRALQLWDGQLDLGGLPRLSAKLMVLAACGSHEGKSGLLDYGHGALYRAALSSGAEAVIAARWDVDDEATSILMARFYAHLLEHGRSKALALAQREMIGSEAVLARRVVRGRVLSEGSSMPLPAAAPYSWAAFTLSGRWR